MLLMTLEKALSTQNIFSYIVDVLKSNLGNQIFMFELLMCSHYKELAVFFKVYSKDDHLV
jgi:hypothetical protein